MNEEKESKTKIIQLDRGCGKLHAVYPAVFYIYDAYEKEKSWIIGKNIYIKKSQSTKWTEEKAKLIEEYKTTLDKLSRKLQELEDKIMED